jgi:hypothetical protein
MDLSGMTIAEAFAALGFKYELQPLVIRPPRYGRKWMTRRARQWRVWHPIRYTTALSVIRH